MFIDHVKIFTFAPVVFNYWIKILKIELLGSKNHCLHTVSYTHLDVYKRQQQERERERDKVEML